MDGKIKGRDAHEVVNELVDEMMSELKQNVHTHYIKEATALFKEMGLLDFFTEDVLETIFENSSFMDLFKTDPDFLFEDPPTFWGNHILSEIKNSIDLEKLKQLEDADAAKGLSKKVEGTGDSL